MPDGLIRLFRPKITKIISPIRKAKTKAEEIRARRKGKQKLKRLAKEIELQTKIETKQAEIKRRKSLKEKHQLLIKLKQEEKRLKKFK